MVNVPVLAALAGTLLLALKLAESGFIPTWGIGVSFLLAIIFAWLIWSFTVTKWRIWAFQNVKNVHELKQRAIDEKLIWRDGSIFEKTEFRTRQDAAKLAQIQELFYQEDRYEADDTLDEQTEIYYSKTNNYAELFIFLVLAGGGIYLLLQEATKSRGIGAVALAIGIYYLYKTFKKILDKQPQIIINEKGIETRKFGFKEWSDIVGENVTQEGFGKSAEMFLVYCYDDEQYAKIELEGLKINRTELSNMLRTYRMRYEETIAK